MGTGSVKLRSHKLRRAGQLAVRNVARIRTDTLVVQKSALGQKQTLNSGYAQQPRSFSALKQKLASKDPSTFSTCRSFNQSYLRRSRSIIPSFLIFRSTAASFGTKSRFF